MGGRDVYGTSRPLGADADKRCASTTNRQAETGTKTDRQLEGGDTKARRHRKKLAGMRKCRKQPNSTPSAARVSTRRFGEPGSYRTGRKVCDAGEGSGGGSKKRASRAAVAGGLVAQNPAAEWLGRVYGGQDKVARDDRPINLVTCHLVTCHPTSHRPGTTGRSPKVRRSQKFKPVKVEGRRGPASCCWPGATITVGDPVDVGVRGPTRTPPVSPGTRKSRIIAPAHRVERRTRGDRPGYAPVPAMMSRARRE